MHVIWNIFYAQLKLMFIAINTICNKSEAIIMDIKIKFTMTIIVNRKSAEPRN